MDSPQQTTSSAPPGNLAFGCLGAILIHPLLFVLVFLKGFVLGSGQVKVMSATGGGYGPTEYLLEGGFNAMGNLAVYYIFIGFIVIPIASLVGSAIAIVIGKQWSPASSIIHTLESPQMPRDLNWRKLAIWAASLYIASFCVENLLYQLGDAIGWNLMGYIFVGTHWGIWFTGAIVAYRSHRDWRISAWLIGIALLLSLVINWFARFGLLVASVATLLCLLSYPEREQPHDKILPEDPEQLSKK